MKIGYVADSTMEFAKNYLKDKNILIAKLGIEINGEKQPDDVSNFVITEAINKEQKITTSQPSPVDFLAHYESHLKNGCDKILVFTVSSSLSGTYNSALLAATMLPEEHQGKVHVIDTEVMSYGSSFLLIQAIKHEEEGMAFEEILKKIDEYKEVGTVYSVLDSLKTLHQMGRLRGIKYFVAKVLNMKPIVSFRKKVLKLVKAATLGIKRSLKFMLQIIDKFINGTPNGKRPVVMMGTVDSKERLDDFYMSVSSKYPNVEVKNIGYLSPIISSHVGPGCIGIYLNYLDGNNNK